MTDLRSALRAADPHPSVRPYGDLDAARLLDRATAAGSPTGAGPVSMPPRHRRPLVRLAVGVGVAAAATVTVLGAAMWKAPVASAGIELTRDGDYYLVRITEPERDSAALTAALQARGLDITLRLEPVSPSLVGSMPAAWYDDGSSVLEELSPPPCLAIAGCAVGLRVPVDYTGQATVVIGREARPGENYSNGTSSVYPGERFACQELRGRPVADVVAEIESAGLSVEYRGTFDDSQDPAAYEGMLVNDVLAHDASTVYVFAQDPPFVDPVLPQECTG